MKKISLTALFYCLLGLVFYSCCTDRHRITGSSGLTVRGATIIDSISSLPVVTGTFSIADLHEFEVAGGLKAGFGTAALYATSCEVNFISAISIDETELYFDQPLTIDNVSLPAGYNLLTNPTFSEHITLRHDGFDYFSSLEIMLDASFFNPPIFTNGPMNIRLVTRIDDGTTFESETDVFVDMQ